MTLTNEDLSAISQLLDIKLEQKLDEKLDQKLQPINDRLNNLEENFKTMNERMDTLEENFKSVIERLDIIEYKQNRADKKLENLRLDVAVAERDIRRDILELKDEMETVIEVMKINELIPA